MNVLRLTLIAVGAVTVCGLFGGQIKTLEGIKQDGETVFLDLRPADPRALMMGDYMALRYREEISTILPNNVPTSGQFILTLNDNKVGEFSRVYNGAALSENEVRINYIRRKGGVSFGAPRYYFQNGTAEIYEDADYGIFKVAPSGRAILVGLADEGYNEIRPPAP